MIAKACISQRSALSAVSLTQAAAMTVQQMQVRRLEETWPAL